MIKSLQLSILGLIVSIAYFTGMFVSIIVSSVVAPILVIIGITKVLSYDPSKDFEDENK